MKESLGDNGGQKARKGQAEWLDYTLVYKQGCLALASEKKQSHLTGGNPGQTHIKHKRSKQVG